MRQALLGRRIIIIPIVVLAVTIVSILAPVVAYEAFVLPPDAQRHASGLALSPESTTVIPARILAELRVLFVPEGHLSSHDDALSQRARIEEVQDKVLALLDGTEYEVTARYKTVPYIAIKGSPDAVIRLQQSDLVVRTIKQRWLRAFLNVSVPQVEADQVQAAGFDGTGQAVAIIDSGVSSTHPFLAGKVVAEACYTDSNCPNGTSMQVGPGAAAPCPQNGCDHGTHVAGIAAGFNPAPVLPTDPLVGVASSSTIVAVQIFSPDEASTTNTDIHFLPEHLIRALEFIFLLHIDPEGPAIGAVNLSGGGGQFSTPCIGEPARPIIQNLRSVGVPFVAASGNDGYKNALATPACIPETVSVGRVDANDVVAISSNSAYFLDLLAPGSQINSSVLGQQPGPNDDYARKSGTSMAAPHVAGAFAILRQSFGPALNVDVLEDSLKTNGLPVIDSQNLIFKPRIRIFTALGGPTTPPPAPTVATCGSSAITIFGTNGPDVISGTAGDDVIHGLAGDDIILGLEGNDVICGGPGIDAVHGGRGNDVIFGDQGNDILFGNRGEDEIEGGAGQDTIEGGFDNDILSGGFHKDLLKGQAGDDTIMGGDGQDWIFGGVGTDGIWGDSGSDTIHGGSQGDTIRGGDGNDTIHGNDGPDIIQGNEGNDTIDGNQGNDTISGKNGNDTIRGGAGADVVKGDACDASISPCTGDDTLYGNAGNDDIEGNSGDDTIRGNLGNDVLRGHGGDDTINGNQGNDTIICGGGSDTANGGLGIADSAAADCESVSGVP